MYADKQKTQRLLKIAKGQIDGILKMVDEDRYCVDISGQLMSTISILKKVNQEVLHAHMCHCVKDAVANNDMEKIDEMIKLMDGLLK